MISGGEPFVDILQTVDILLVGFSQCQNYYYKTLHQNIHICAGGTEGSSCSGLTKIVIKFLVNTLSIGDSGGPLFKWLDGYRVIIGVVSFGMKHHCNSTSPSVYTNVSEYGEWIISVLKQYVNFYE